MRHRNTHGNGTRQGSALEVSRRKRVAGMGATDGRCGRAAVHRTTGIRRQLPAGADPNLVGFEAALDAGATGVAVFAAASESFSRRNVNCSIDEALARFAPIMDTACVAGVRVYGLRVVRTTCCSWRRTRRILRCCDPAGSRSRWPARSLRCRRVHAPDCGTLIHTGSNKEQYELLAKPFALFSAQPPDVSRDMRSGIGRQRPSHRRDWSRARRCRG